MGDRSLSEGIPDESAPAEIVPKRDDSLDKLRRLEDRVLTKALRVVEDGLSWADIDPGEQGIPDEWMKECGGLVEAQKRQRAALAAQKPASEAPVGLKLANAVFVGIVKARATEKQAPRQLNIAVGRVDFQLPNFPRVKVDR